MARWRVKPGFTFGAFSQHRPGDIVEMTEAEAAGFLDKLEQVDEPRNTLGEIPGVGADIGLALALAGFASLETLAVASDADLLEINGMTAEALGAIRLACQAVIPLAQAEEQPVEAKPKARKRK
jgi:hypothetical protein